MMRILVGSAVLVCLLHLAATRELTLKPERNYPIHPHDWYIRELRETSIDTSPPARLKFRPDGTFKILFLTDLHFGEDEAKDNETVQLHHRFLHMEKPDLVVLGGDQVSGWVGRGKEGWLTDQWNLLTLPFRESKVPYAIVLGNHDAESKVSRREVVDIDIEAGQGYSLTQQGPEGITGASNYWLDIDSGSEKQNETAARLWFFDSMNMGCRNVSESWGCVGVDTLEWLENQSSKMKAVPAIGFVHIPVPQIMMMWENSTVYGKKLEFNNCPVGEPLRGALFDMAKNVGIEALFSGHDHNNDYIGKYDGMLLAYGRKSGVGGYGRKEPGGRVLLLKENSSSVDLESWIVLQRGRIQQQLNEKSGETLLQEECSSSPALVAYFLNNSLEELQQALQNGTLEITEEGIQEIQNALFPGTLTR